ncbi:MAG TPA: oligosaccharide flippase family protein [Pyrinomonadaceae bacterium]|nr:oligosaccharide flippase family protein [Pyrinomonadaceae bacterium]
MAEPNATERGRFSTQVALTLAVRLVMTGASVFAGIIVARWLGAEGLGQLAVINVSVATVVQLASAGLPSANTYFIAQDQKHLAAAAVNSLLFAIVVGGLLAFALVALATAYPAAFNAVPSRLIAVAAVAIPFQLMTLIGLNIFLALGQVKRFNMLDLAGQVFVVINALIALIVLGRGLWTLVSLNTAFAILVAIVVGSLITIHVRRQQTKKLWRPQASLFASMIRYGMKFHVSILAGALIFRADLLVVNHYRGSAEAGVYSVASQVAMMLMLLPGVIATLLFPRVAAEQDKRGETTALVSRHSTFVMCIICLAAAPVSFVLPVLYGDAFADVPVQLLILLPGVFLIGLESVLVQHFNAMGLPPAIPIFWVLTLLLNLILVFALVPPLGARGAAIASSLSYLLIFALVAGYFRWKTGRSLADTFLLRASERRFLLTPRNWTASRRSVTG